jgi:hypothetical protein
VLSASFWLAPYFAFPPQDLAIFRWARRAMRPTNFCHLHDTAYTRTSCVPGSLRGFHRVDVPRSLGLRATYQGTECFTALANASADRNHWTHAALPLEFSRISRCGSSRAWVLSPHGAHCDRASDTSVASPSCFRIPCEASVRLRAAFWLLALASYSPFTREEAAKAAVTTLS